LAVQTVRCRRVSAYNLRMNDARAERARAASTLARARWGTSKLDGMIHELRDRADQLGPEQVAELRELVATAGSAGTKEN
jgi:hypothetical protein